jgi:signal transduction histidine kinase
MSERNNERPADSGKVLSYADISPAGQASLLDVAFARINYGFGAMLVVGLPFIAWYIHLGQDARGLIGWTIAYIPAALGARRLYRSYLADSGRLGDAATIARWLPRVHLLALAYGLTMTIPPLLTGGKASFEFQLLYMVSIASIIAGNATHQSPVLSVFRRFLLTGWGLTSLLIPYTFPEHWPYVFPLAVIYMLAISRHAVISHQFFLKNIVLQEQAEKALYDKNLFLTTASHDLRQPVHAMGFLVESISRRNLDPALDGALTDLRHSVRSATQMFNALLDLSRIESGTVQIRREAVDLAGILDSVLTVFREEANNRGLALRVRLPPRATIGLADATMLRQSLGNLLHNALRYTRQGGILLAVRRRGDDWRCEVWDTGVGVATGDGADIFSPFFRNEHAWSIDSAGHGLGLAVVARCCALMGAAYGFRSREGKGSCFWICLHAAPAGMPVAAPGGQRPAPAATARFAGNCLVVDDDPLVRSAWETLLQSWGLHVACVESGAQSFRLLASGFTPDAVFCDQRLRSGESGFDLLRELLDRLPKASGAMISGELDSPELAEAEEQGYLVLRKPVEPEALEAVLDQWLSRGG